MKLDFPHRSSLFYLGLTCFFIYIQIANGESRLLSKPFCFHSLSRVCLITGMFELALWGEKRMEVWNCRVFQATSHSRKRV